MDNRAVFVICLPCDDEKDHDVRAKFLREANQASRHNLLLSHDLSYFGLDPSSGVGHSDYAKRTPLAGLAK